MDANDNQAAAASGTPTDSQATGAAASTGAAESPASGNTAAQEGNSGNSDGASASGNQQPGDSGNTAQPTGAEAAPSKQNAPVQKSAFMEALEKAEAAGKRNEFLEKAGKDYSKTSADDLHRMMIREQYGRLNLTDDQVDELLLNKKEANPGLSEATAQALYDDEAEQYRAKLTEAQEAYRATKFETPDEAVANYKAADAEAKQQAQTEYRDMLADSPEYKAFAEKRLLSIGEGDSAFNYAVPEGSDLLSLMADEKAFSEKLHTTNSKGEKALNVPLMMQVAALVNDPKGFYEAFGGHSKTLTDREQFNRTRNPGDNSIPAASTPASKKMTWVGEATR